MAHITRPELTFEEFCSLPMHYTMGLRFSNGALRMFRNESARIQKEIYTPFKESTQKWGEQRDSYFLDGDEREFSTIADWYVAYMHKACNEPEQTP